MILVLVEHDRGKLNELSLEALTFGRSLAEQTRAALEAVLIGAEAQGLAEGLGAHGASKVHLMQDERLVDYAPEAWAQSLTWLIGKLGPQAVLAAASDRGSEVMAHVGAQTDLPLAANCIEVTPGYPYVVTRLRWGGSLLEEARLKAPTRLLTVAPHALEAQALDAALQPAVETHQPELSDQHFRVRVTGRIEADRSKVSLAEARAVVGGGRGMGSTDGFKPLEELALALGGAVGCSRAVTSLGWRPHLDQIGQTGTRIAPDIYIACGISGAIQHMVGCKAAKNILAINSDPDAPIFAQANYGIIGDAQEVVAAINAALRKGG
jgi:electron transfer flavoprotein alpha subunit